MGETERERERGGGGRGDRTGDEEGWKKRCVKKED